METFPTLPEDLCVECLIRVPCENFSEVALVCREWNRELNSPEFIAFRKLTKHNEIFIAAAAEQEITLFYPLAGRKFTLPNTEWVNRYSRITCIGSDLVVMSGNVITQTMHTSYKVHIYNFVSGKWRLGANMPGEQRSDFGYGSDGDRWIYVVGGKGLGGLMDTAIAYDLKEDAWINLPNMILPRCCSTLISHNGNIWVIGGDQLDGSSITNTEIFDVTTQEWNESKQITELLRELPNIVYAQDGNIYRFVDNYLLIQKDKEWCTVAELPCKLVIFKMIASEGKLIAIGFVRSQPQVVNRNSESDVTGWAFWENGVLYDWPSTETINAYLFDLRTYQVSKVIIPSKYLESCYCLDVCSV